MGIKLDIKIYQMNICIFYKWYKKLIHKIKTVILLLWKYILLSWPVMIQPLPAKAGRLLWRLKAAKYCG
jgi:hypothetical protein